MMCSDVLIIDYICLIKIQSKKELQVPKLKGYQILSVALILSTLNISGVFADDDKRNIIAAIVPAPVVSNGLVAKNPTEFNIILAPKKAKPGMELDPDVNGYQIPMGGRLELELSGSFMRNKDVTSIAANANIIMTTGPQNPIVSTAGIGVQHANWSVADDGNNLITITPNGGKGRRGLENARANMIGIKVIHLRPNPNSGIGPAVFWNGSAGSVGTVILRIYDKNDKLKASGFKDIIFHNNVGRQVHITNAGLTTGAQGNPNTLAAERVEMVQFQKVAPNTMLMNSTKSVPFSSGTPYAPRFLLFENANAQADKFIPQSGIDGVDYMVDSVRPWTAKLMENETVIGAIVMEGPTGKSRGMLLPSTGSTTIGGNGSVLNVPVKVGKRSGIYKVTVTLIDGNSATNTIKVVAYDD